MFQIYIREKSEYNRQSVFDNWKKGEFCFLEVLLKFRYLEQELVIEIVTEF